MADDVCQTANTYHKFGMMCALGVTVEAEFVNTERFGLCLILFAASMISACSTPSDQTALREESGSIHASDSGVPSCLRDADVPKDQSDRIYRVSETINQHHLGAEDSGAREDISIIFLQVKDSSLDERTRDAIDSMQRQVTGCLDQNSFDLKVANPNTVSKLLEYYEEHTPRASQDELERLVAGLFEGDETDLVVLPIHSEMRGDVVVNYYVHNASGNSYYINSGLVIKPNSLYDPEPYSYQDKDWDFPANTYLHSFPNLQSEQRSVLQAKKKFKVHAFLNSQTGPGQYQWLKIQTSDGHEGYVAVPYLGEMHRKFLIDHQYYVTEYKGGCTVDFSKFYKFPEEDVSWRVSSNRVEDASVTHILSNRPGKIVGSWAKVKFRSRGEQNVGFVVLDEDLFETLWQSRRSERCLVLPSNGRQSQPRRQEQQENVNCGELAKLAREYDYDSGRLNALEREISHLCGDKEISNESIRSCITGTLIGLLDYDSNRNKLHSYVCE